MILIDLIVKISLNLRKCKSLTRNKLTDQINQEYKLIDNCIFSKQTLISCTRRITISLRGKNKSMKLNVRKELYMLKRYK